ncbi:MAG: chemotaxis protein CheA, partial [Nitratireductor sp.]
MKSSNATKLNDTNSLEDERLSKDFIRNIFFSDCDEQISELENGIDALRIERPNTDVINTLFRAVHSIKGGAASFELKTLTQQAHIFESALDAIREDASLITKQTIDLLKACANALKLIVVDAKRGNENSHLQASIVFDKLSSKLQLTIDVNTDEEANFEPKAINIDDLNLGEFEQETSEDNEISKPKNDDDIFQFLTLDEPLEPSSHLNAKENKLPTLGVTKSSQPTNAKVEIKPLFMHMKNVVQVATLMRGNKVEVVIEGEQTKIEEALLAKLYSPLVHIVRNAVAHGIESPNIRAAQGKAEFGTITLCATKIADQLVIEVKDDGAGINREKVLQQAIDKGIKHASVSKNEKLTNQEIDNLIFEPGFSTANNVSKLSGRGVGMDVVRESIERIGGQVDIQSTPTLGSTIKLSLP